MARLKLTEDLIKKICDIVSEGNYYKTAALAVGISEKTFYNWKKRGEEAKSGIYWSFLERIRSAENVGLENKIRDTRRITKERFLFNIPDQKLSGKERYIYLVKEEFLGLVKIGVASNLRARLAVMRTNCPQELKLLHFVKTKNAYKIEKVLHENHLEYHYSGEWFDLDNEQINEIKKTLEPIAVI